MKYLIFLFFPVPSSVLLPLLLHLLVFSLLFCSMIFRFILFLPYNLITNRNHTNTCEMTTYPDFHKYKVYNRVYSTHLLYVSSLHTRLIYTHTYSLGRIDKNQSQSMSWVNFFSLVLSIAFSLSHIRYNFFFVFIFWDIFIVHELQINNLLFL